MVKTAIIAFEKDRQLAEQIRGLTEGDILIYENGVFERAFMEYNLIVAIMAAGIVVRKISPLLRDKWKDPGVVVVDAAGRFAIPILGGHHGANELAERLSEIGIIPVITTATEAYGKCSVERVSELLGCDIVNKESTKSVNLSILREDVPVLRIMGPKIVLVDDVSVLKRGGGFVVGIGTRKGVKKEEVVSGIREALSEASLDIDEIDLFATSRLKEREMGLIDACRELGKPLVFLADDDINSVNPPSSSSKAQRMGLKGVCEPCALVLSKRGELILSKRVYGSVTIAIAR